MRYRPFKKIYLYDLEGNLVEEFKTTDECADYLGKDRLYLYHNLKYCKKIKFCGKWYRLSRELIEK